MPVQSQIRAFQHIRFQAFVPIGDYSGHIGLSVKCIKEIGNAIHGAIILTKLPAVPVRRGYWGNKIDKRHAVPCKVTAKCGSEIVDVEDCYTTARGSTGTVGNFAKATYVAIARTCAYLTLDL
uniref:S5 DRBM domain-containing protein n=1 Tax=Glossina austeni TaxID=7395 RepID=A0A1A9VM16_GLOAU